MSAFDSLAASATQTEFAVFADPVTVDGVLGRGIVTAPPGLMLGEAVHLHNASILSVLHTEFPSLAFNSQVSHVTGNFIVTELYDVDAFGWRRAMIARN